MNKAAGSILKEILLGYLKILVGIVFFALALELVSKIHLGRSIIALSEADNFDLDVIMELLNIAVGKLPFVGYILNLIDVAGSFQLETPHSVFHSFVKMMLLSIPVKIMTDILCLTKNALQDSNNRFWAVTLIRSLSTMLVLILIMPALVICGLVLHEYIMRFWISIFGNGAFGNWTLLGTILCIFILIYFAVPVIHKKKLINETGNMLLDFGLVLCAYVCTIYIALIFRMNHADIAGYMETVFPTLFLLAAFFMLLRIKAKNKP